MSSQAMVEKRDQLRARVSREEGRQSERQAEYDALKQQAKERFGTDDPNKLSHIYETVKKQRTELQQDVHDGYALAEQALAYLEKNEPVPGELTEKINALIEKTQNNSGGDSGNNSTEQDTSEPSEEEPEHFSAEFEQQDQPDNESDNEPQSSQATHPLEKTVSESQQAAQSDQRKKSEPASKQASIPNFDIGY